MNWKCLICNFCIEYRKLDCTTNDKRTDNAAGKIGCHLVLKNEEFETGRNAPEGSGCYTVSEFHFPRNKH